MRAAVAGAVGGGRVRWARDGGRGHKRRWWARAAAVRRRAVGEHGGCDGRGCWRRPNLGEALAAPPLGADECGEVTARRVLHADAEQVGRLERVAVRDHVRVHHLLQYAHLVDRRLCRKQGGSKARRAQPSDSWLSGGFFRRQFKPQAAPSVGYPRSISRLGALAGPIGLGFDMGVRLALLTKHARSGRPNPTG